MTQKSDIKKLREFLVIERDKTQEKLGEYAAILPCTNKQAYSRREAFLLQRFSAIKTKLQTYCQIIDLLKEMEY